MPLPDAIITEATQHAVIAAAVSIDPGIAVVYVAGSYRFFNADAWDRPDTDGFLPWQPPAAPQSAVVAIVFPDGTVRYT